MHRSFFKPTNQEFAIGRGGLIWALCLEICEVAHAGKGSDLE